MTSWSEQPTKTQMMKALMDLPPDSQAGFQRLIDAMPEDGVELHPALKPWLYMGPLGQTIRHPYVYDHLTPFSNPNEFYRKKRLIRREYMNERNLHGMIYAIERPWRMTKLMHMWKRKQISHAELQELLPDVWTDTEMPQVNQDEPLWLFKQAGFVTDDPEAWSALSNEITVYRGVDGDLELTPDGPSWTTDIEIARFFAYRFAAKGTVYGYDMKKDEALAYLTGRDETEIILDWDKSDPSRIYEVETRKGK